MALIALCVCIGISAYVGGQYVLEQNFAVYEQSAEIAEMAQGIVDYRLPPGYTEQFGMSIFGFDMAAFGSPNLQNGAGGTLILLAQFPKSLGLNQDDMQQQMEEALQQQSGQNDMQLAVVGQTTAIIRDQTVPLVIREGTDDEGHQIRQITGVFEGKGGTVMLMIMGSIQQWDQNAIDTFIASLR